MLFRSGGNNNNGRLDCEQLSVSLVFDKEWGEIAANDHCEAGAGGEEAESAAVLLVTVQQPDQRADLRTDSPRHKPVQATCKQQHHLTLGHRKRHLSQRCYQQ